MHSMSGMFFSPNEMSCKPGIQRWEYTEMGIEEKADASVYFCVHIISRTGVIDEEINFIQVDQHHSCIQ